MKLFQFLFIILIVLLFVIGIAAIAPQVEGATGAMHPEFKGILISPANIDQVPLTRWLGFFFGIGIILLFGTMLLIGNRKNGEPTSISRWLYIGIGVYLLVFTCMVVSHWSYSDQDGGVFFMSMPAPTAWMIFGVWFVPLIITVAYIWKFEEAIISEEENDSFQHFLQELKQKDS